MPSKKKAAKKKVNAEPVEQTEKTPEPVKPIMPQKQEEQKKVEEKVTPPITQQTPIAPLPKTDLDKKALRALRFQFEASQDKSTSEMKQVFDQEKQKMLERCKKYGSTNEEVEKLKLLERAKKYNTIPKDPSIREQLSNEEKEKKRQRLEKFNDPNNLDDDEKKKKRIEKFSI